MSEGYIKLYRSLTDWEWYKNPNTRSLFIHILLTVSYKDEEVKGIPIKRGQGIYTIKGLAEVLGMSEQNVRTALANVKSTRSLTTSKVSKYTLISVQNYEWYQGELTRCLTSNQRDFKEKETDEERKKEKKQKKIKKEEEREIRNIEEGEETRTRVRAEQVRDLFNSACAPLPRLMFLTKSRREKIGALLDSYSMEDIRQGFHKAGKSSFLSGGNDRRWKADFDWLVDVDNFAKLLEGKYDDKDCSFNSAEFFETALRKAYGG